LKGLITDRGLSAVDLFLAHLFTDTKGFGSNATLMILKAEKDNKTQLSEAVIKAIYPDSAARTAFFKRNVNIFKVDRSATIEQALEMFATKLDSGFAEVRKLADEAEADVFGNSIPSTDLILGGVGDNGHTDTGAGGGASGAAGTVTGVKNGIDRRQFLD